MREKEYIAIVRFVRTIPDFSWVSRLCRGMVCYLAPVLACAFPVSAHAALTIPITVNLSEAVNITGTPQIAVDVGGTTRYATYTSGTGTNALTFTLTPQTGDVDLDGITVVSPLQLNGGTIKDIKGNDAALTFTPPNTANVKVNYPSLGMDFVYDADGRYTLNGTPYNDLPSFLSAAGGSFTRASIGTYYDSTGTLQTAASGVPRFDYDPVTHTPKGILIEESRTNNLPRSHQFDDSGWTKVAITVSPDVTTAPDGTMTADRLSRTSTGSNWIANGAPKATTPMTYTGSVYVKLDTARYVPLRMQGSYPSRADVCFDLQTGTISLAPYSSSSFSNASASIQPIGNGWYRLSLTAQTDAISGVSLIVSPRLNNSGVIDSNDTSINAGIYVWGAQLEQGSFPTSYIPTTTATVTRAADGITVPFQSIINPSAGTALIDAELGKGAFQISGATVYLDLLGSDNSGVWGFARNSSANILVAPSLAGKSKLAVAYGSGNVFSVADGGSLNTGSGGNPDFSSNSKLWLGSNFNGAGNSSVNGHIRKFKYYPARVTDTQLQLLTQ